MACATVVVSRVHPTARPRPPARARAQKLKAPALHESIGGVFVFPACYYSVYGTYHPLYLFEWEWDPCGAISKPRKPVQLL